MSVIATLVIASNGATALDGSSTALSTPADRERFLTLHRSASAYITGRNSFSAESYARSSAPVLILSRSGERVSGATVIDSSHGLPGAMRDVASRFASPIVVEAGPTLLIALVSQGCIEEIQLSISPVSGDENFIDYEELLKHFAIISDEVVDGTRLLHGRYNGDSAYR